MLQFEELRLELNGYEDKLVDLAEALGLKKMVAEVTTLEEESAKDGFWDDVQRSQKITQHMAALKNKIKAYDDLKAVFVDTLTLIELANESSTITELSEKLNISRPSVRKMLIKANIYQSFIEKNQDSILHTKPILQYDKNGNFIKEWKSTAEMTKELGIKEIHYVLRGERKTAGGFIWKYKKDVEGME